MDLVSVILTTLDSEQFVARSIESCLNQTHRNLELVVVDGGSRDRTLEIVGSYRDPRIRIIHQEDNVGKLPGAINLGMANANGDFITWTQDDCWYEPNAIETMLGHLDANPDVALVYTDFWQVDQDGNRLQYSAASPPENILISDIVGVCFLFRREVYDTVGPQDTKYFPVHEVPWRVRVAQRFKIQPLHIPLMYYVVHSRSLTGRIGNPQLAYMAAAALLEEGHFDTRAYRRQLAQIDIDQAFDSYVLYGDYFAFWRHALSGIGRDWRWLRNRGLLKLMLVSLTPARDGFRSRLLARRIKKNFAGQPVGSRRFGG